MFQEYKVEFSELTMMKWARWCFRTGAIGEGKRMAMTGKGRNGSLAENRGRWG